MILLLSTLPPPPPPTVTRNRTGVVNLVKAKAPATVKHDLAWWLAWLEANW